jgi:hypothetical protein
VGPDFVIPIHLGPSYPSLPMKFGFILDILYNLFVSLT